MAESVAPLLAGSGLGHCENRGKQRSSGCTAELQSGIQTWCEAHRDELTGNGKVKFANLTTGEVQWRNRPPSVSIRGADNVIELLRRLGLERFIRVKEEINKDAILNEKEAVKNIPGISIKSDIEDFSIIPFEQDVQ